MTWYYWALILFAVGIVEYLVSEYENLLSVRLRIGQTLIFATVNRLIDLAVQVAIFGLLNQFYEHLRNGTVESKTLIPYILYVIGTILGTGLALTYYKKKKRKTENERRKQQLERARQIKKELQNLKHDIITEIEEEFEFEDHKEEKINAPNEESHNKTDLPGSVAKQEEHKQGPSQDPGTGSKKA